MENLDEEGDLIIPAGFSNAFWDQGLYEFLVRAYTKEFDQLNHLKPLEADNDSAGHRPSNDPY